MTASAAISVMLKRGSLQLSAETYQAFLHGADTVRLLRRDRDLLIMPMQAPAAGNYSIEVRTVVGDRMIHALGFFNAHGLGENIELELPVTWSEADAALIAERVFLF